MKNLQAILKGYLILFLSLFIFVMWGVNLVSLSQMEKLKAAQQGQQRTTTSRSSTRMRSTKPYPFLYYLLKQLGYGVLMTRRITVDNSGILLIINPPATMNAKTFEQLQNRLKKGGNVIIITSDANALSDFMGITGRQAGEYNAENLTLKLPYNDDIDKISGAAAFPEAKKWMSFIRPFKSGAKDSSVIETYYGPGKLCLISNADFQSITGLEKEDNLYYLIRLIDHLSPEKQAFIYDNDPELTVCVRLHIALPPAKTPAKSVKEPYLSLWSLIKANPISWVLLQLALGLTAFFHSWSKRFGKAIAVPKDDSPDELFFERIGDLLSQKGDYTSAMQILLREFLSSAYAKFGISPSEGLDALIERIGFYHPETAKKLQRTIKELLRNLETKTPITHSRFLISIIALEDARKELKINA